MVHPPNIVVLLLLVTTIISFGCERDDHQTTDYDDIGRDRVAPNHIMETSDAAPPMLPKAMASSISQPVPNVKNKESIRSANKTLSVENKPSASTKETATSVSTNRMIIRNGSIRVSVNEIEYSIEYIKNVVADLGGWVVSYSNESALSGNVVIRIPSEKLDDFLNIVALHSDEVISTATNSMDVTDQYIDNTSRLLSLETSENALITLMGKTSSVEQILKIRKELKTIQADIEALKGKIKYLEQSSAFSRVDITLNLTPKTLIINSGEDRRTAVGELVRLKALFQVPNGSENFTYIWDFGDGSPLHYGERTAPTNDPNERTTATVSHVYYDDKDSPFIAKIELSATGDAGIYKGEDSSIISVTRMPTIEVFAGDYLESEEGEEVTFEASFTRPPEIQSISYKWEFGDGQDSDIVKLSEKESRIIQTHTYKDHRSYPYRALITVYGETESGTVEGIGEVVIQVREVPGWTIGGLDVVDTAKFSVRSLSAVGYGLLSALIWIVILSPIWATITAAIWFGVRYFRRRKHTNRS